MKGLKYVVGGISPNASHVNSEPTRFLGTSNPAAVKRNVLASFTNILLLPVTIVPRTVGAVGGAIGGAFRSGVTGTSSKHSSSWISSNSGTSNSTKRDNGAMVESSKGVFMEGETVFSIGDEDEEQDEAEKG